MFGILARQKRDQSGRMSGIIQFWWDPIIKKRLMIFLLKEVASGMSLYVHRPSVTDKTCAPKGDDTFYVLACVPNLSFKNDIHGVTLKKATRKKYLMF